MLPIAHCDRQQHLPDDQIDKKAHIVNRSLLIALGILIAILGYFGVRSALRANASSDVPAVSAEETSTLPEAVIIVVTPQSRPIEIKVKGQTAPDKTVTVKSGTQGTVVATPAREGTYVKRGALLCGLDVESRSARLSEAEAYRDSALVDYDAASQLAEKGLSPANRVKAAKASLDAAEASINAAKVELSKTQVRAPFAGIFESRLAERGDFLSPGSACGVLVDMSPVIMVAEVSETYAGRISVGMESTVTLSNGRKYPAELRYVSRTASQQTRTFVIEAALDTGEDAIASGLTATLAVPTGEVMASHISPALLSLSDGGELGVRIVLDDDTIHFLPVQIIDETGEGAWVTGLPETARLVSKGQDYLSEGVKVSPIDANGAQ